MQNYLLENPRPSDLMTSFMNGPLAEKGLEVVALARNRPLGLRPLKMRSRATSMVMALAH